MSKIIERIERDAGIPNLAGVLADKIAPTDLQSLLLEVSRRRAGRRAPAEVLFDYERDPLSRPSALPAERLLAWERTILDRLPEGVEALALSPVCPLGTSSVVAGVDQNWAVATVRGGEVVSDVTNVLALEAALRRRAVLRSDPKSRDQVHLAASHRVMRGQRFHGARQQQHFALFGLVSAGRDLGSLGFELGAFAFHVEFYLRCLRAFLGNDVRLRLSLTDFGDQPRDGMLNEAILGKIRRGWPEVETRFDGARQQGRGYYRDLCFHLDVCTAGGDWVNLVDGGVVDWTAKLLSNAKERMVISGVGSERVCDLSVASRESSMTT